jgi:tryptophanyl-tRNA synthetase
MARHLVDYLAPIREKRAYYEARPELVEQVIDDGCRRAGEVADATMADVRRAMKI